MVLRPMNEQPDWPVRLPPLSLVFVNDDLPDSMSPGDGDGDGNVGGDVARPELHLVSGERHY
jgi:hypothetical protein